MTLKKFFKVINNSVFCKSKEKFPKYKDFKQRNNERNRNYLTSE